MSKSVTASAHGRVNLIGEHTDYNGGFVLPTAIPQTTHVTLVPRLDRLVRVTSKNVPSELAHFEYELGKEKKETHWVDYVQGVTSLLLQKGHAIAGFDLEIDSTVPLGGGLSSSAALEVALLRALREAFNFSLENIEIAKIGQKVENEFVGAHVGIMDQMASALSDPGMALFLDTRDLSYRKIPIPVSCELIVIHSGISHRNAGGDYNTRRAECEKAAALLGVGELRDVCPSDLGGKPFQNLPAILQRRARHVITENERVLAAVRALESTDLETLGELFGSSHASMRDDYQVSIPEIDLLVQLASAHNEVYGARLTGGGFGGSVVIITKAGGATVAAYEIARKFAAETGLKPRVLLP